MSAPSPTPSSVATAAPPPPAAARVRDPEEADLTGIDLAGYHGLPETVIIPANQMAVAIPLS
jgi:hypothetical protein